ncbi:MAG: hypothetical protein ABIR78_13915 [Ferruginibacter sp.]
MIPDNTGRYCNSCKKSVIDFTEKTDGEIQQFISSHPNEQLCGRFKNSQVQRIVIDLPENIFSIRMPGWMRFLTACLLIFGISIFPFETSIAGKNAVEISFYQGDPVSVKTDKKPRIIKKKKRRYKTTLDLSRLKSSSLPEMMILGGFGMLLSVDRPILNTILDLPVDDYAGCSISMLTTETGPKNKSLPQKEPPGPTPYMPTEFILPSILLLRKETDSPPTD